MKITLKLLWTTLIFGCIQLTYAQNKAPQSVEELWRNYNPKSEPLNVEVLKKWEKENGNFEYIRFDLGQLEGTNKSASPKISAYYGYPKEAENVPAVLHLHGGGQRAEKSRVEFWVKLGFACISINWGEKEVEEGLPNTDWDGIAAGFLGREEGLMHWNDVTAGPNTLYSEPHPMNSSWTLVAMAGRRALTFLEERPEVDATKLGVEGHSMGGKLTVQVAIDSRVKAAAPSVGGTGYLHEDLWGLPHSKRGMQKDLEYYKQVVDCQSYWPEINTPILFLGSTDDFNSPLELVIKGMSTLPKKTENILVLAPHLNHRFTDNTDAARFVWMQSHLQGKVKFPKTSATELKLKTKSGIPVFKVKPDETSGLPIEKVEVYYGYSRDPRVRFFRSAIVTKKGNSYEAECPVFDAKEPLFAFANITYNVGYEIPSRPGRNATNSITVTSEYQAAYPEMLAEAKVKATEYRQNKVDDFKNGMQDWYTLYPTNRQHWFYSTRKVIDPSFMGPEGGTLKIDLVTTEANNKISVEIVTNQWLSYTGRRKEEYTAVIELPNKGLNTIELVASDFKTTGGKPLKDWDELTELSLQAAWKAKGKFKVDDRWSGESPELKSIQWVGGDYSKWRRFYPHEKRNDQSLQKVINFDNEFQDAIDQSVKLEKQDSSQ
ncbi:S9 family peptidase [Flammeovirga sp. EKP202]|uniref:alpha/beta hydrolase family protein n=1 Tax=Flammeovirga sp. EKP202 TaxID=2770592 RepID=UPI00165FC6E7|nr:prolyl oligopeptidase family serine peptidase [Flammeovirga sp. EKP202]MBD0400766.1 prolyl oligopeptidase family serine peptidase [Flammeovirga sp. EKP202]